MFNDFFICLLWNFFVLFLIEKKGSCGAKINTVDIILQTTLDLFLFLNAGPH